MQNGNVKYKLTTDVISNFKGEVYGRQGTEVIIIADHGEVLIVEEVEKFKIACEGFVVNYLVPMIRKTRFNNMQRFPVRADLLTIEEVVAGPSRKTKPKPVGRGKKKATVPTQQTELFA